MHVAEFWILALVIITALAFDFTNGFHDTGNAMATSIATGALKPKLAVSLSAVLNLIGAFLSVEVAATVAKGIVNLDDVSGTALLTVVLAGLVGGILWNVVTWLKGMPSSSSHALFGGLIGASIASMGMSGVAWDGVMAKILIPALLAPVVAGFVAAAGTRSIYKLTHKVPGEAKEKGFRWGQVGSASLVSLAHGTNDAQKTMGVIFLALVAHGTISPDSPMPFWVKFSCAFIIALGTYLGGWRVIRTLGKGLVEIDSPQGMAAETASAAIILTSSSLGLPLSTTHVATGSILGSGLGRRGASVRWSLAGRMGIAWLTTIPAAGAVGAICWGLAHVISGATNDLTGVLVVFGILVVGCFIMWRMSQAEPVNADNVNDAWDDGDAPKGGGTSPSGVPADLSGLDVHASFAADETTAPGTGAIAPLVSVA